MRAKAQRAQRERGSQADGRAFLPFLSRTTPARGGGPPGLDLDPDEAEGGAAAALTRNSSCRPRVLARHGHVAPHRHYEGVGNSATIFSFTAYSLASSSRLTSPGVFTGHRRSQREKPGSWDAHLGEKCEGARPCGLFSFGPRSPPRSLLAESVCRAASQVPARNPLPCSWDSPIGPGRPRHDMWAVTDG